MRPSMSIQNNREWLESLLNTTFSDNCTIHEARKNALKRYCIDCKLPACLHCIKEKSHARHRVLMVYRYVSKDAVPLDQMKKHIDCSKIQAYKSNKKLVLPLTPPPHNGSGISGEGACDTCMRRLYDPKSNCYCSIVCKVQAFLGEKNDSDTPSGTQIPAIQGPTEAKKDKRPRKGTPHRAPMSNMS